jgi:hypothetical protein
LKISFKIFAVFFNIRKKVCAIGLDHMTKSSVTFKNGIYCINS